MPEPIAARRLTVLVSLIAAATLGMLASTIYVPSIPAIARGLGTTVARVQLTFVGYLLAFAAGMLVLGPLSDRYGRRRTLIFGMALSTIASLCCAASPSIGFLIGARIAQGIGACAGMVVGRATIRDLYGRDGAAQVIAALAIVATLVQSFAPIPGGYLQEWVGWRANFAAVTLYAAAAMMLAIRYVPETHTISAGARQTAAQIASGMLATYRRLTGIRRFLAYALAATGAHAGFHIFTAGAPSVLIGGFGIRPEAYGFYASLPPIGFLAGSFLSNRLTRRLGIDNLIVIGSIVLIPAGLAMVVLALLHASGPYTVIGPMILICCASGLITPNALAGSLGVSSVNVGAASGLASFLQMTGAAAATAALSLGPARNPVTLALVTAAAGLFAVSAFGLLSETMPRPKKAGIGARI
ncbi:MAG TPA: multidrug effflux MFS transporter [Stellaceae bacterium]|nr:multidrug effflux MFS transporter [Stellaceae bacterium]